MPVLGRPRSPRVALLALLLSLAAGQASAQSQTAEPPLADPTAGSPTPPTAAPPARLPEGLVADAAVLPAGASDATLVPSTGPDGKVIWASVPAGTPAPAGVPAPRRPVAGAVADPPTPVVTLRVRVPREVAVNQEIEYRIVVENRSQADAHHVTVRDLIPDNATLVAEKTKPEPVAALAAGKKIGWELGTLKRGEAREVILVLRPKEASKGAVENRAWVQFEHGQVVTTAIAPGKLAVRQTGPKEVALNETAAFRLEVANNGAVDATNVEILDQLPAGLIFAPDPAGKGPDPAVWADAGPGKKRWLVGTLKAGQRKCLDFKAKAVAEGRQETQAVLTAAGGVTQDAWWSVAVTVPKLQADFTAETQAFCGRPVPYRLDVRNVGTATLENVVVTANVPANSKLVSLSQGGQKFGENVVQWVVGKLEPGAARAMELKLSCSVPGKHPATATFTADLIKPISIDRVTEFQDTPGLDLQVRGNKPATPEVNSVWQYAVRVVNTGTSEVKTAQVRLVVPPQLRLLSVKPAAAEGTPGVLTPAKPLQPGEAADWVVELQARAAGDARLVFELWAKELGDGQPIKHEEGLLIAGVDVTPASPGLARPPAGMSEPSEPPPPPRRTEPAPPAFTPGRTAPAEPGSIPAAPTPGGFTLPGGSGTPPAGGTDPPPLPKF